MEFETQEMYWQKTLKKRTAIFLFLLAVFLFAIDRLLKSIALEFAGEYSLIGEILKFSFAKNYFIAFSLPLGGAFLIILISIIIITLLVYSLKLAIKKEWLQVALLTNILFGAISNLLDRLQLGYVVDYIDLKYFTVFNTADIMIVGGTLLLLIVNYKK